MPFYPHTANTGGGLISRTLTPAPPRPSIQDVIREATALNEQLPPIERVHALIARLYCYISRTATELETAADDRPSDAPALAAVREARRRLARGPGNGYISAITYTRNLARSAEQLLHHHTQLPHPKENS
ncbi:DUF6415 family natural product biosynthesis protein [Streptomyces luteireticuli]|uniref:DUF6415 family natural product biosynthesis protein n=1 Tax=Streptomyces luteireticuli TaxID=173858 RepID=UPI003557341D